MKKVVKLISLLLATMVFVTGCKSDTDVKSNEVKTSKKTSEYINLTMIRASTINPILNTDKSVSYVLDLVYDSLFELDENYNIQPKLVESYSISSNNKKIDITLKDNIKWHDGESLTAKDVKYTYELINENKDSAYNSLVSNISGITVHGSKKLTINFKDSYAFSLETLIFPIVSKDKLDGLKTDELKLAKNNLVGSGAYKIKKYEDRDYMILELNSDYYDLNKDNNKKEVYVKMVPDTESQTEMVLSLDSDISKVTLGSISKFTDNDNFVINKYQGRNYDYVLFNYDNKYLNNLDIRKAISFAVDRKSIIKDAYSDRAKLSNFPLNSTSEYYDSDLKPLSYNTENAQNYLKKAVLSLDNTDNNTASSKSNDTNSADSTDNNKNDVNSIENTKSEDTNKVASDGNIKNNTEQTSNNSEDTTAKNNTSTDKTNKQEKRTFKDVTHSEVKEMLKDITFKIIVNKNNTERVKAANIISNNLEAIGIKTEIKDLTEDDMQKALKEKDYDLALIGCELPAVSDATYVLNKLGYSDKKLDKYITQLQNATSEEEIKSIYKTIQKYVKEKAIFISFGILNDYVVLNGRLKGELNSNDFDVYSGIDKIKMD
ncbi:MAG: ABC transporter substrate-binding protein [Clostridiales bacterium]|uniref:ABC transporter substrate-binding protein n=1 Tax=Intestinibacter sp. TaxID=1965304 RepID=UPI0025D2CB45|nr:ABC transporter substrate-binding protein [uncultured Intestinibacter sp.]MDU1202267.1 ABC transporter substrate-binding protein [Clostridiales bacterium]